MIDFEFQEYCSGCGACGNICPVGAIAIQADANGFQIPSVDREKCVGCGKCDTVCPHLNRERVEGTQEDIRAVWLYASKDEAAKLKSSSGAACFALGERTLEVGGYVAGCVWDERLRAVHGIGDSLDWLRRTQGSKYVQSDVGMTYREALKQLRQGKRVLFTGTPCQATAMHNIAANSGDREIRERLIIVGVICHGVASPKAWESFKEYTEHRENSPLVAVNFRDKNREGYKKSYCRYDYADGRSTYLPTYLPSPLYHSKYIEATLVYNLALRSSCSHCDCKGINRGIDLIVGDWYAEYTGVGKLGTSCIVAFTECGKRYAEEALEELRPFEYRQVLRDNALIESSVAPAANRKRFFDGIDDYHYWDRVEELYPPKYKYKKLLVRLGIYDVLKKAAAAVKK